MKKDPKCRWLNSLAEIQIKNNNKDRNFSFPHTQIQNKRDVGKKEKVHFEKKSFYLLFTH